MKAFKPILVLFLGLFTISSFGQTQSIRQVDLSAAETDNIIKKFTANEHEFREALNVYAFDRSATVQSIGMGGQISGVYRRDSFMTFTGDGARFERVTYAPVSTLKEFSITPQDLEDLGGVNPFALEPSAVAQYNFRFVGKEKIDELDLYVFDVVPKVIPDPKKSKLRLFTGRVWVDDRDLMIVKSKGKAVPEDKNNKYPIVETWRENVDGKYWFPSLSLADDTLEFDRYSVRMKLRVKYENYRLGRSDVKIVEEDAETPVEEPKPSPSPTPKP